MSAIALKESNGLILSTRRPLVREVEAMPGRCVFLRSCRSSVANATLLAARVQRSHTSSVFNRVQHTHRLLSSSSRGKPGGVPAGGWRRTSGSNNNRGDFHVPPPWVVVLPATLVAAGGSYYFSHREAAPFTGRMRFVSVSDYRLRQIGLEEFAKVKRENAKSLLAETHPASKLVSKVGLRIATAAGVPQHELATWQFLVIRNDQPNAFVLPGGFVCVYTGLFRVAPTEEALACVLAHEVGHLIARHVAEKLSRAFILNLILLLLSAFDFPDGPADMLCNLLFELPNSRQLETEADVIGLHLLAKCCEYNPAEMPRVFIRFNAITDNGPASSVLQYISTHPCNDDRIANQKHLLPGIELEQARHCHKY